MARLREIVVDAEDPPRLARFWAAALDGYAVRAYDAAEIARLAALGLTPDTDPTVAVDGPGPTLFFQLGRPPPPGGRLHLDLAGGPRAAEVAQARGARREGSRRAPDLHGHARPGGQPLLRPGPAGLAR